MKGQYLASFVIPLGITIVGIIPWGSPFTTSWIDQPSTFKKGTFSTSSLVVVAYHKQLPSLGIIDHKALVKVVTSSFNRVNLTVLNLYHRGQMNIYRHNCIVFL